MDCIYLFFHGPCRTCSQLFLPTKQTLPVSEAVTSSQLLSQPPQLFSHHQYLTSPFGPYSSPWARVISQITGQLLSLTASYPFDGSYGLPPGSSTIPTCQPQQAAHFSTHIAGFSSHLCSCAVLGVKEEDSCACVRSVHLPHLRPV